MAHSRTPPALLRRRTLSTTDKTRPRAAGSATTGTSPSDRFSPSTSTQVRMDSRQVNDDGVLHESTRLPASSMTQLSASYARAETSYSPGASTSSSFQPRRENAKYQHHGTTVPSQVTPLDGHFNNLQDLSALQPQRRVPPKSVSKDSLNPAKSQAAARRKNNSPSHPTHTTVPPISRPARHQSTERQRAPGALASSSQSQLHPAPLDRSVSPEIPVYVPTPTKRPEREDPPHEPKDEHGLPLIPGKRYLVGAPLPSSRSVVVPQPDRSPISAYRSATRRGRGRGKGKYIPTGRPRGRPRKHALDSPARKPEVLVSATTVGLPVGLVPVYGHPPLESAQPYSTSVLPFSPDANTPGSIVDKGKGRMPRDGVQGSLSTSTPLSSSSHHLGSSGVPDADTEWYLDLASVTWCRRPRQSTPAEAGPSRPRETPRRMTTLPAPHSTSSSPSKAQTPARWRSPSDAPSPTPSNVSLRSIPFVQVEPLRGRLRAERELQAHASITSSEPSSSYRRSPSVIPDSEVEEEGEGEEEGEAENRTSETTEGVRAISRPGSLTPSTPVPAAVTVPELPEDVNSGESGFAKARGEDVSGGQIAGIGGAVMVEEPVAESTSNFQLPTGISEVDHVVQTLHVLEFQNQSGLFASLREAIVGSSREPSTSTYGRPRLEFAGCYSVLIDPAAELNKEVVDSLASTLANEVEIRFRRVENPTAAQTQQQDPTKGVITQYECMCGGLRGPVGLPSPPPTSESDVQNLESASTACGGMLSIGVSDIRAGFMRGMKVTVCARHP